MDPVFTLVEQGSLLVLRARASLTLRKIECRSADERKGGDLSSVGIAVCT